MSTEIVDIPAALEISPFPALGSANYNEEAYANGASVPPAIERMREIVVAGRTNALAAQEQAAAAVQSVTDAGAQANRARDEADLALGFRNQAGQHAGTASDSARAAALSAQSAADQVPLAAVEVVKAQQQVELAAEKVGLAAAEVAKAHQEVLQAKEHEEQAAAEADRAAREAGRAAAAADSISSGPITSLNVHSGLKTGAVTLELQDLGSQATDSQMQAGTLQTPLLMSPANVKAAIAVVRSERTAGAQLINADVGKWIALSGTFTQAFLEPAALGAGWWCYLQNSGAGDIAIPASDGRTNWIMYPGEMRLFQCDGEVIRSVVLNAFHKVFASSGDFIKPPGYLNFGRSLWSGGGSGGVAAGGFSIATGGGGSACVHGAIPASALADIESVVIGAGGVGKVGVGNGNAGGRSSFAGSSPDPGGGGNAAFNGTASPGAAGQAATPTGGPVFLGGTRGSQSSGGVAAADTYVYMGGGAGANAWAGSASGICKSLFGGDGSEAVAGPDAGALIGKVPQAPGAGSGAVCNTGTGSGTSSDGARGELQIWGVI